MAYLLRGAFIEYASDFLGPLPNVVIFQFNPETISRAIQVPARPTGGARRETTQAGDPPLERITLKAENDRLDIIAQRQYNDPTWFWHIADANTDLEANNLVRETLRVIVVPQQ